MEKKNNEAGVEERGGKGNTERMTVIPPRCLFCELNSQEQEVLIPV